MINQFVSHANRKVPVAFSILVTIVSLLVSYSFLRYTGYWGETDTNAFSNYIYQILASGTLVPETGIVYPNGYGYQALAVFVIEIAGLEVAQLQLIGGSLLAIWMVFPAWMLYRELTGSSVGASLATLILFVQPEFLFPIFRGTHEKFTRGLMLLGLYLLVKSFRSRDRIWHFTSLVLSFYLVTFAIITFNNLLAISFVMAIGLSLILGGFLIGLRRVDSDTSIEIVRRLAYVLVVSIIFAFLFTFYVYEPAQNNVNLMQSVFDRVSILLLDVDTVSSNPYASINTGWISVPVYFVLSLPNWLILLVSTIIWLGQSWKLFKLRDQKIVESQTLLWSFYGAFAFIGFLSIIVDLSGALASNLQHRAFPSFTMLAAPLIAYWLTTQLAEWHRSWIFRGLLMGVFSFLALVSILKATNEPLLSNKWLFHHPNEMQALYWANDHLEDRLVWIGFDERLRMALGTRLGTDQVTIEPQQYIFPSNETRDFLVSDIIRARSQRLNFSIPLTGDSLQTYDNGQVQIYHKRPVTTYQR
ncbi:MAG TPA: hypothetical protein VLL52_19900 [Anaerolineae bacterium]|nr:hypothetical protein [Anaerolineae bacterium]